MLTQTLLTGLLACGLVALLTAPVRAESFTITEITHELDGVTHRPWLLVPQGVSGPQPGVLVIHEWTGRNEFVRGIGERLAVMGYVALVADIYGEGRSTTEREQASAWATAARSDVDKFQRTIRAAFDTLLATGLVDPDRTASIGFCFGGTASLQLAYSGAPVTGIVSFHGNPGPPREGEAEGITAKILILHGAADPFVPQESLQAMQEALNAASHVDWQQINYGHAVHSFMSPGAGNDPSTGAAYDAQAAARAWEAMRAFFREIFGEG